MAGKDLRTPITEADDLAGMTQGNRKEGNSGLRTAQQGKTITSSLGLKAEETALH